MLKLKFYQVENVVLMKVLEQDNKEDLYFTYDGLIFECIDYPAIENNRIYLQGSDDENNNKLSCYDFETSEKAKNFIDKAIHAVKAYNKEYSQTEDEPEIKIQEFIAE